MSMNGESHEVVHDIAMTDLDGILAKRLTVPQGSTGVVIDPKGKVQTYPAGTHTVVNLGQALFGRTADLHIALLPAGVFPFSLPVPRLHAGDGTWVDINLGLLLRVTDPGQAAKTVSPAEELAADLSTALDATARQAAAQWSSADLSRTQARDAVIALLSPLLEARLQALGMTLQRVISVTVRPSDEAVEVARQMRCLNAAMAEVDMDHRMAMLTSQAEWYDFARQVEADFGLPDGALATMLEAMGDDVTAAQVRRTVAAAAGNEMASLGARVQRLAGDVAQAPPSPPPLWWEPLLLWMKLGGAGILLLGLVIFAIAPLVDGVSNATAGIVLGAAAVLAAVLVGEGLWLDRKAAIYHGAARPVRSLLERLGRGERQRIDRLVRGQLAREFGALSASLRDVRNRAYRDGLRDTALAIKDVEESTDRARRAVESEAFGSAAYLVQAEITREQLDRMLRYDEELLARSATLGNLGAEIRQAFGAGDTVALEHVKALQAAIAALDHQTQARARFIQAPTQEILK